MSCEYHHSPLQQRSLVYHPKKLHQQLSLSLLESIPLVACLFFFFCGKASLLLICEYEPYVHVAVGKMRLRSRGLAALIPHVSRLRKMKLAAIAVVMQYLCTWLVCFPF